MSLFTDLDPNPDPAFQEDLDPDPELQNTITVLEKVSKFLRMFFSFLFLN
jgi:hypothetical protein